MGEGPLTRAVKLIEAHSVTILVLAIAAAKSSFATMRGVDL